MNFAALIASLLLFVWLASLLHVAPANAQTPPGAAEVAKYTGLFAAAQSGNAQRINALAAAGADLNARDSHGRTPLMVAAFAGNLATAGALMDAGAEHGLLENDKYDALTIAAVAGNSEMVKLLIAKGARTDLVTSIYDGTALIAAAHLGHVDVVKALIAGKAPLDHVNNLNWTALIEAIVLGNGGKNHTQVVRDLVTAGANVNIADGQGRTPLTLAKARGYGEMVLILEQAEAR